MNEFIPTSNPETPANTTGWENMDPQLTQPAQEVAPAETPELTFPEGAGFVENPETGEITSNAPEAAAMPVFSAEATAAAPAAESEPVTFPEGTGFAENPETGEITPNVTPEEEPAAMPVFSTEATAADATATAGAAPAAESEPVTFPEGTGVDAYELEGRDEKLGDVVAAGVEKATETIPEPTAAPESNEQNEAVKQAIADIRDRLDQIEANL